MAADGSIIIDTQIDTTDVDKGPKEIKKHFEKLSKEAKSVSASLEKSMKSASGSAAPLKAAISELEAKTAELKEKMSSLSVAKLPTEEYIRYSEELNTQSKKLDSLLHRQARMKDTGNLDKNSQAWKNLQYDIMRTESLIRDCEVNLRDLENTGQAFTMGHATEQAARLKEQLFVAEDQLKRLKAQTVSLNARTFLSNLKEAAKTVGGKIVGGLKSAAYHMGRLIKNARGAQNPFNKLSGVIRRLGPAMLAAEGVMGIFRKAVNALMQENEELSAQMQACWSSLGSLLEPVVTRLIGLLSTVVSYITQFLALLGIVGSSTSKSISKAGSSASKEMDKLKKQLASFDEINTLGSNDSSDSGSGDTASVPAADVTLPDWATLIAEQLKAGNFKAVGEIISDKIVEGLGGINWGKIQSKAIAIGAGIGLFLTGALADPEIWNAMGMTLAEGLNTAFYFLLSLITTFDWLGVGRSFASGLNTFVSTIDWVAAGKVLSEGAKGLLGMIVTVIEETDWKELGNKIAELVGAIDWAGILNLLAEGAGAIIGGLGAFLWGLVEDAWGEFTEWMYDISHENGEFTVAGLLEGLLEGLKNIGTWIYKNILLPIWNGFTKAFEINSPSKLFKRLGEFIIQGLLDGIVSLVSKVVGKFTEIKNKVVEIFTQLKTALKTPINGIIGFINGMLSGIVAGINKIVNTLNGLSFELPDWLKHVDGLSHLAGKKIGFNLNTITTPQIPYLAKGAVIPPNAPFAAILGDQKHGTNIEAPLETIQEALAGVLAAQGSREVKVNVRFMGSLAQLGRVLQPVIEAEETRKGPSLMEGAVLA